MSYGASESELYFHLRNLNQMRAIITHPDISSCGVVNGTNQTPNVNANFQNINNKSIPVSTPFELTGSASDPDGDQLLYTWEQWDVGSALFRNFSPYVSPSRSFPALAFILANTVSPEETLPDTTRDLNFQFVARD